MNKEKERKAEEVWGLFEQLSSDFSGWYESGVIFDEFKLLLRNEKYREMCIKFVDGDVKVMGTPISGGNEELVPFESFTLSELSKFWDIVDSIRHFWGVRILESLQKSTEDR